MFARTFVGRPTFRSVCAEVAETLREPFESPVPIQQSLERAPDFNGLNV